MPLRLLRPALALLTGLALAAPAVSVPADALAARPEPSAGRMERFEAPGQGPVPARTIDVWLPPGYPDAAPYAVAVMFDGQMLFDASTTWNHQEWRADETASALQAAGRTRPFIIVGVWNAGEGRHSEYFPQRPFESLPAAWRERFYADREAAKVAPASLPIYSDAYLRWLTGTVLPEVEHRFRVSSAREDRVVIGSSMGGLIATYALSEYPEVFAGFGALSTHWPGSVPSADNPIPPAFYAYLREHLPTPGRHRLYFDHGDATLDALYPPLQAEVDRIAVAKGWGFPDYRSLAFPGAEHDEKAWAARLDGVFTFLLPPRAD